MKILKKIYDIRLATKKDRQAIMLFIKKFWPGNHILGRIKIFLIINSKTNQNIIF